MSLQLVKPSDVDLSQVDLEFAHLRRRSITYDAGGRSTTVDRRAALARPPFCDSKILWERALEFFYLARGRGEAKGEPFIVVTNIYRQLGGGFR